MLYKFILIVVIIIIHKRLLSKRFSAQPRIGIFLLCTIEVLQQIAILSPVNDRLWLAGSLTLNGIWHTRVDGNCTARLLCEYRL